MTIDTRSPLRLLWSVLRQRPGSLMTTIVSGALWMVPTAVLPMLVGHVIGAGIHDGRTTALLVGVLLIVLLAVVQLVSAGVLEWTSHSLWIHATESVQRTVLNHLTGLGMALPRRVRAGEAMATGSSDIFRLAGLFETLGRAAGSVVSFLVAAVVLLVVSPTLGLVVLIGVPLATTGIGPLLAPLRRREEAQRERFTEVNGIAADIVSGLRILRGVGGESRFHARFARSSERVRETGVAAGRVIAWLAGAEVLLPGLVTVLVTWLGARLALAGDIGIGELVAFYGVSAFLVAPVRTGTEAAHGFALALVAAGKVRDLLRLRPEPATPPRPRPLPEGPLSLHDETTGLEIRAGALTVIDAGGGGEEVAERLTRHIEPEPPARVLARGADAWVDPVPLDEVVPAELRSRIVLAHNQDLLFSGPAREELDLESGVDLDRALAAADAADVLASLPDDGVLDERGRSLSGGQRQRLLLTRALCADADVLVLDEPTSAVDAHTEARIVHRVRALRQGRTTVVFSQSPLWKSVADHVGELA